MHTHCDPRLLAKVVKDLFIAVNNLTLSEAREYYRNCLSQPKSIISYSDVRDSSVHVAFRKKSGVDKFPILKLVLTEEEVVFVEERREEKIAMWKRGMRSVGILSFAWK